MDYKWAKQNKHELWMSLTEAYNTYETNQEKISSRIIYVSPTCLLKAVTNSLSEMTIVNPLVSQFLTS